MYNREHENVHPLKLAKDMTPAERRAYVENHVDGYAKNDRSLIDDAVFGGRICKVHLQKVY